MDPETQLQPQAPMQPQSQPQPEQPKRGLSKKLKLITIGAAVLVVGIILVVVATSSKDDSSKNSGGKSGNVYYDRPGYDRSKLSDAIGDPAAVKMTNGSEAVKSGGDSVLQACNVLRTEDITKQGLLLGANTIPSVISRSYDDGVGKGGYAKASSSSITSPVGLGMDVNGCNYVLESESLSRVSVNVLQPFAVPESVVNEELQRSFTASAPVQGLEVFTSKPRTKTTSGDSPSSNYFVRAPGKASFFLSIQLPSDKESKKQALLEAAAQNFIRELNAPSAPQKVGYESPVFGKTFTRACDIVTNEDVRAISGRDAGALAREGIASSVGVLHFNAGDNTRYNYISSECTRATVGGGLSLAGGGEVSLKVETTSYLEDAPAKLWIEGQRHTNPANKANMPVSGVADEAVAYADNVGDYHLIFRKGRTVINTQIDRTSQQRLGVRSLSAAAEKLTPISQAMAARVQN
jgi:hypothetical protein